MMKFRLPCALLAFAWALSAPPALPAQIPAPSPVAFVDVNVVPMDRERVLERQTVIVRNGRIAAMGPVGRTAVPAGAQRVDGRGKFLMPGLAEMHAHIPPPQAGAQVVERTLFLYLANGITTIRGMLGHPGHLELRRQTLSGQVLGPRIYTSGPSLNGNSAKTPEQAERMVTEQKAAGYDFLKLHPGLSRPVYDAIVATGNRAGMAWAGHVSADVGLQRALETRQKSIDHLDGYVEALATTQSGNPGFFGFNWTPQLDESRIPALAAATRAAGVWNVPTQSLLEHLAGPEDADALARRPEMRYMPPQTVAQWVKAKRDFQQNPLATPENSRRFIDARRRLIRALHDADAGLLLGSDAPQIFNVPGFAIHHELQTLVASGLTPYQALATGTRNVATYFGTEKESGTVETGKVADLLLLNANPLTDVRNVQRRAGVMVRGRWLPESEIQKRLEAIAASVRGASRPS